MKKSVVFFCVTIVLMSVLAACNKANDDSKTTVLAYNTTETKYTVGTEAISKKDNINSEEYEINYYDDNFNAVKCEHYKNDKLCYYRRISGADENGNGVQEKYYDKKDRLIATYDSGYFYDGDGIQISEDRMMSLLDELLK